MLDRLRQILDRPTPEDALVDAQAAQLIPDISALRPSMPDDIVGLFVSKVTSDKLTGTVEHLESIQEVPGAVAQYGHDKGIAGPWTVSDDPLITSLDWADADVTSDIEAHRQLAIGVARLAVAETGSFVVASSRATPSLHSFLPLHHVIVIPVDRIRPYLEDVWLEIDPRNHRMVNLITGTSGTADIEGRNVRGAHGPRFLHVLLVGSL